MKTKNKGQKVNRIADARKLSVVFVLICIIRLIRRIFLSNVIGDDGNAFYSAPYEFLLMALAVFSYSIPLAISKLVSARIARGQFKNASRVFRIGFFYTFLLAVISSALVFFLAEFLSETVFLEPRSVITMQVFAVSIVFISIAGVFRGYFRGIGTEIPGNVTGLVEQLIFCFGGYELAKIFYSYGTKVADLLKNEIYASAYGSAGSMMALLVGSSVSVLILLLIFGMYHNNLKRQMGKDVENRLDDTSQIVKSICMMSIPICTCFIMWCIGNLINQRLFYQSVTDGSASAIWGAFDGKFHILVFIPAGLSLILVKKTLPNIFRGTNYAQKNTRERVSGALRWVMVISLPCSAVLSFVGKPIISGLFKGNVENAADMLQIGSTTVIFFTLTVVTLGVLQNMNLVKMALIDGIVCFVVRIIIVSILIKTENLSINAVIIGDLIYYILYSFSNLFFIKRELSLVFDFKKFIIIPAVGSAVCTLVVFGIYKLFGSVLGDGIAVLIGIIIGNILYFTIIVGLKAIREDEAYRLPAGGLYVAIARAVGLLK